MDERILGMKLCGRGHLAIIGLNVGARSMMYCFSIDAEELRLGNRILEPLDQSHIDSFYRHSDKHEKYGVDNLTGPGS